MIGAMYASDQRIVEIYKEKSTIAESNEDKLPPEKVLDYIELISVNNKSLLNFKPIRLRKASWVFILYYTFLIIFPKITSLTAPVAVFMLLGMLWNVQYANKAKAMASLYLFEMP